MFVVFIGHLVGGEGVYMCEGGGGGREDVYMCEEGEEEGRGGGSRVPGSLTWLGRGGQWRDETP